MRSGRLLILASALVIAGCGGSPHVASVASTTSARTSTQPALAVYARCMRSHGVPGFPDPDSSGGIPKAQVVAASRGNVNAFKAASTACSHLLPNGSLGPPETEEQRRTRLADELSFARCMRSHGVARFPDPTAQGELTIEMVQSAGIDVRSSAVLRVVEACLPASHGGLTPAKIREALSHAAG
jgi:hypothetical protein